MEIFFDMLIAFVTLTVLGAVCGAVLVLLDAPTRQTREKKVAKKEQNLAAVNAVEE